MEPSQLPHRMYIRPSVLTFGATRPYTHQVKVTLSYNDIYGDKNLWNPLTKPHNSIPAKLVFRIYKKQYSHLSKAIGQVIAGAFFFNMKSCEYSTTPK